MLGGSSDQKQLVEMSPFRDNTSDKDASEDNGNSSIADRAKGWLGTIAAPITSMKEQYEKDRARAARVDELKGGATMMLLPDGRGESVSVKLVVSSDGAMVTWTGPGLSGVMAMSAIREVKPILQSGFFSKGAPIPNQWMLIADDQTVRFEASSEEVKEQWMGTLEECAAVASEAKAGRKMAQNAKRRMGLEERRRENERRKAEVMKTCGTGMKHTAAAMMTRS